MPSLVNGLGGPAGFGENTLFRNDDSSTGAINITSVFGERGLNFFGTYYTSLYVNNNGNITFQSPTGQYTPSPIGQNLGFPIVAALWTDIDTRFVPSENSQLSPGGTSTGTNWVYYDLDTVNHIFTVTWDDVDYYSKQHGHPSAFQIRLIANDQDGNFGIEFRYESIGVTSYYTENARAGYSPGTGPGGFEFASPQAATQAINLATAPGNTGLAGLYRFNVEGGIVSAFDESPTPTAPPATVEPFSGVTFSLGGLIPMREGASGDLTTFQAIVHRTGADLSATSSFTWSINIDDVNDLASGQALSGSGSFGPLQTDVVINVQVRGDDTFERDDYFMFSIDTATHAGRTIEPGLSGTAIIINDDSPVSFTGPQMRPEGNVGVTPFDFTVMRVGDLSRDLILHWQVDLGQANAQDLAPGQALQGDATIDAGSDHTVIQIKVAADVLPETDEAFTINLTSATSGTTITPLTNVRTTGVILDDDVRQNLLVGTPNTLVKAEGDSGLTVFDFQLMRVGDVTAAASVPYAIGLSGANATSAGEIASPLTGSVSFAPGSALATLSVTVNGDTTPETDETFAVTLGGGDFNTLVVSGVIMNDDRTPTAGSAAPAAAPSAALDGDISGFMMHLTGGGLWSDGAIL